MKETAELIDSLPVLIICLLAVWKVYRNKQYWVALEIYILHCNRPSPRITFANMLDGMLIQKNHLSQIGFDPVATKYSEILQIMLGWCYVFP
jgi:hypothetical protein